MLSCVERDGATLLVSRGGRAGYSDWERVSGQQTVMYMEARDIAFDFDGRTLRGSDAFTTIVTPTGCEVLACDQTGNPVVTRRRLGKGQMMAVNFALEHIAMTKLPNVFEGDFSNELWRIYAAAAKTAGVRRAVTREDTRLVLTEHPLPDGSRLVCALNTRPEPVSVPVAVDGTVGTVWNGRYVDGKLEIAANDGCMFEVK